MYIATSLLCTCNCLNVFVSHINYSLCFRSFEVYNSAFATTSDDEKIRLFWDNIPLWYNMGIFNYFEKMNGVVVAETYSAAWSLRLNADKPIEALALKSLKSYPLVSCVSIQKRMEMVMNACRDYSIDGVILHRNKSCAPITLGQMDIKAALLKELDIPSVIIDADHMDERNFSPSQFQKRADSFM